MKYFIEQEKNKFSQQSIKELRELGRSVGVKSPTTLSKGDLIDAIVGICYGGVVPHSKETRGRPANLGEKSHEPYIYRAFDFKKSEFDSFSKLLLSASAQPYEISCEENPVRNEYYIVEILPQGNGRLRNKDFSLPAEEVYLSKTYLADNWLQNANRIVIEELKEGGGNVDPNIITVNEISLSNHIIISLCRSIYKIYPSQDTLSKIAKILDQFTRVEDLINGLKLLYKQ